MSQNPSPAGRGRPATQVDLFTDEAYRGNPLAVVADAGELSTEQMQQFANWTNLSETAFLLPPTHPEADYRVRIFTAHEEFPFCRASHAGVGARVARCGWRPEAGWPPGPGVRSRPGPREARRRNAGVRCAAPDALRTGGGSAGATDFEVRTFIPGDAAAEGPVTGSFNAGVAQSLIGSGRAPSSYIAAQGTVLGRAGRVHVGAVGNDVWVGGRSTTCISGTAAL